MFIDVYSLPKIFSSCTNRVATVVAHSFLRYQPGHWNNPSCSMPYLEYDVFNMKNDVSPKSNITDCLLFYNFTYSSMACTLPF